MDDDKRSGWAEIIADPEAHGYRVTELPPNAVSMQSFTVTLADSPSMCVGYPSDGSCSADGCEATSTCETLIGIRLCDDHFSRFYSAAAEDQFHLKPGIVRIER